MRIVDKLSGWDAMDNVLIKRYAVRDPKTGEQIEQTFDDVLKRVSTFNPEKHFDSSLIPENERELYSKVIKTFYKLFKKYESKISSLIRQKIILGSTPILMNFNSKSKHPGLFACFPLGRVGDSMDSILQYVKDLAIVFKYGGGAGIDLSDLRPKNSYVDNKQGYASGPCSFMYLYGATATVVSQGSKRRGALMIVLSHKHPDLPEFIQLKDNIGFDSPYHAFNSSVRISLKSEDDYKILREISDHSWKTGDPGVIFEDNALKHSAILTEYDPLYANPCAEYLSVAKTACNLHNINILDLRLKNDSLSNFFKKIYEAAYLATIFGTYILYVCNGYPIDLIRKRSMWGFRPVGVGLTGLHECLIFDRIRYSDPEAEDYTLSVQRALLAGTQHASIDIGNELKDLYSRELPPKEIEAFNEERMQLYKTPINPQNWCKYDPEYARFIKDTIKVPELDEKLKMVLNEDIIPLHCVTTTQMPSGTMSQIARVVGTGIEPMWELEFVRRVRKDSFDFVEIKLQTRLIDILGRDRVEKYYEPALSISPDNQLKIMCCIQKYCHTSVSKTVNTPYNTTPDEMFDIFKKAKELGLKSLTVFRDGCRDDQILKTETKDDSGNDMKEDIPSVKEGRTWSIRQVGEKVHITINKYNNKPIELFIVNKKLGTRERVYSEALAILISKMLQKLQGPVLEVIYESLEDLDDGSRYSIPNYPMVARSIPDLIAKLIRIEADDVREADQKTASLDTLPKGDICPSCGMPNYVRTGSCRSCLICGYSTC